MIKSSQFWLRIGIAALALLMILNVRNVYWPIVVSLIITFVLMPLCRVLSARFDDMAGRHIPIDISIIISFFVLIFVLFVITNSILKPLIMQVNLLAANFQDLVARTGQLVTEFENEQTQVYIPEQIKIIINDAIAKIGNYGVDGVKNLISTVFVVAGTMIEFFVVPIITFYFMKDGKRIVRLFIQLFPQSYHPHLILGSREIGLVLSKYIRGQLLMSCIIATLTFSGMWLLGVPYPMVIALLAGITEWIPVVGPIIGALPAILLGALVSPSLAVKVLVFYIVIQQVDSHLIMPQVMGTVISIHPVAIVIALLIGGSLFGIAGMVLAVPVTAVLQVVCKHLWFYDTYKAKAMNLYGKN